MICRTEIVCGLIVFTNRFKIHLQAELARTADSCFRLKGFASALFLKS